MKFLHTADWHVGKTLKGRDRLDEQRAVLAEIAAIAEANEVDAVLVAGDVYDLSAPSAPAQQLVVQALLRMRRAGAEVIVIAGNHDHGPTFEAYRPLMGVAGHHPGRHRPVTGQGRGDPVHRPLGRRGHAGGGPAVPVPALRGARRRDRREHPVGERPRLRRAGPPGHRGR